MRKGSEERDEPSSCVRHGDQDIRTCRNPSEPAGRVASLVGDRHCKALPSRDHACAKAQ